MGQARRAREAERVNGKVVVGYVHPVDVSAHFHDSMMRLWMHDINGAQAITNGGGRIARYSSANISNARNGIVRTFLDDTQAEWLWMVDADMQFAPDVIDRLLGEADSESAPIVGGLCFGTDDGRLFATLYDLAQEDDEPPHMIRYHAWPEDAMFQVTATGAACLLVHRSVLVAMRARFPEPFPWFQEGILGGQPSGEDVTFCLRAGVLGFPVFVHTGVQIGHAKTTVLTAQMYAEQRDREAVA